jgi:glycosyltransferase involved in cell wall biosynthesis
VLDGLSERGWRVLRHDAPGAWPHAAPEERAHVAQVLADLPRGSLVLVDGLVGSALGDALATAGRCAVVLLVHLPLGVLEGAHLAASEVRAVAAVAQVVATSRWSAEWLVTNAGAVPDRVRVAVPGVEPAPPTAPDEGGGRLLSVGAITPVKGADRVVATLASVADLPWTWRCVGSADVDPAFAASVRADVEAAGLDDRVRWTGALTPEEVAVQLADTDLLVVGSRVETYGMVVGEALARGIPVLVPPVGGLPEAVGSTLDGRRPGLVAARDDTDSLSNVLRAWLSDRPLRERVRAAALARRAEGLATWATTTSAVEAALEDAATGR